MGIGVSIPFEKVPRMCARCIAAGVFLLVVSGFAAWVRSPARHDHLENHLTGIDAGSASRP